MAVIEDNRSSMSSGVLGKSGSFFVLRVGITDRNDHL